MIPIELELEKIRIESRLHTINRGTEGPFFQRTCSSYEMRKGKSVLKARLTGVLRKKAH